MVGTDGKQRASVVKSKESNNQILHFSWVIERVNNLGKKGLGQERGGAEMKNEQKNRVRTTFVQ